uniref:Ras GEF n=1 Tax=Moniliophthora roreri TaxID=221103 RepID=A0A0W0GET1_MONRR
MTRTLARSQSLRQTLHLSIDPAPYSSTLSRSPDSTSPSSSSRPSTDTSPTSSTSDIIYSVLCMHDFHSDDPDQLSFRRNEILDIVREESNGWLAAIRKDGDVTVGWIPQAFVKPLTDDMVDRLLNVLPQLRIYEYEAEQLYNTAPIARMTLYDQEPDPTPQGDRARKVTDPRRQPPPSPSPATPLPLIPSQASRPKIGPLVNKPTPPTPTDPDISAPKDPDSFRRLPRLSLLHDPQRERVNSDASISPDSASKRSDEKIRQLTGSDEALIHYNSVLMQANMPWYLKPRYSSELEMDNDGRLLKGTKRALVEKLVWESSFKDSTRAAEDTQYRRIFLTTFRTFMSAQELFDLLVDQYRSDHPPNVTDAEFEEWKEKCYSTTQRLVLTVFSMWLEEHRLLEEEPTIARDMTAFLQLIKAPHPLAEQAQLIVKTISRLTFTIPTSSPYPCASNSPSRGRRKRDPRGDLLRLDPGDIAEQLSLLESKLYRMITPQECIRYAKVQTGKEVEHLNAFCSTHDKIAAWVTNSILDCKVLARRADTVDFWIKKCRNLNNFASMSAIINALSSTVVARLHLTWAHVGRKNNLDALLKYNEPTGGFAGYRNLQLSAEGPCVPFVGMYLSEIVHIKDQYSDDGDRISFAQRQRWYEVAKIMLRSQSKHYPIAENSETIQFITRATSRFPKDWQATFWAKSQLVQHSEIANADIRRGLEAAGF